MINFGGRWNWTRVQSICQCWIFINMHAGSGIGTLVHYNDIITTVIYWYSFVYRWTPLVLLSIEVELIYMYTVCFKVINISTLRIIIYLCMKVYGKGELDLYKCKYKELVANKNRSPYFCRWWVMNYVCMHGHISESPNMCNVDKTLLCCVFRFYLVVHSCSKDKFWIRSHLNDYKVLSPESRS